MTGGSHSIYGKDEGEGEGDFSTKRELTEKDCCT
jgi:hypothetical protein